MRAVKDPDVFDEGDGRAFLRAHRRCIERGYSYSALYKPEESATCGSTHVASSSLIVALVAKRGASASNSLLRCNQDICRAQPTAIKDRYRDAAFWPWSWQSRPNISGRPISLR